MTVAQSRALVTQVYQEDWNVFLLCVYISGGMKPRMWRSLQVIKAKTHRAILIFGVILFKYQKY